METLNISKLNLSSVTSHSSIENVVKIEHEDTQSGLNVMSDIDEDYKCEYSEDIWQNMLEQDAQKPTIHLQSPQLEFRGSLVQQLRDATKKLGLTMATLHCAVAQLDLFMDAHRLRSDRLTHVALACLSLAAKSEEKFSRAPTLKTLSKISNVQMNGKTFRQLECMIGQHIKWRLLAPTPVTFAALLGQYIVTESDLTTRHPKFVRRFKKDGLKLLDAYLDLTLSDVRLKVIENVEVGCACVACARADLGLAAWPPWLATKAKINATKVAPIARLLQKMMQIKKGRETTSDTSEVDQGYGSARTSPNLTPSTSPVFHISPASSTCSNSARSYINIDTSYRHNPVQDVNMPCTSQEYTTEPVTHSIDSNYQNPSTSYLQPVTYQTNNLNGPSTSYMLEPPRQYSIIDNSNLNCVPELLNNLNAYDNYQKVNNHLEYKYCKSQRLLEDSLGTVEANKAVKRGLDADLDVQSKRYRMSRIVI